MIIMRKGPPRNAKLMLLAVEYLLHPQRKSGLLKALAYANGVTPSRLNSAASLIRNAK
jgi:hypothetical protein